MRRITTAFVVLLAALVIATLAAATAPGAGRPLYMNPHAGISARVNDLLHRMTLEEKVGQMDQQLVDNLTGPSGAMRQPGLGPAERELHEDVAGRQSDRLAARRRHGQPGGHDRQGGTGNTGFDWANEYNMIQKYAIKNSRLHIPVIFGVDAVHGFGHPWQAPLYPQSIGMGATWDPIGY